MKLEDRIRQTLIAEADALPEPAEVDVQLRPVARVRRGPVVAFAALILVLVGGFTATYFLVGGERTASPDTTVASTVPPPGPALEWQQVLTPPDVDGVLDVWALDTGGFALWSGREIWTSVDGRNWVIAATPPNEVFGGATFHAVEQLGGGWMGIGNPSSGLNVVSLDADGNWSTIPLPIGPADPNDLLSQEPFADFIAVGTNGVAVAGREFALPDTDAILDRFAPELIGQEVVTDVDWNSGILNISAPDGTVLLSLATTDIDPRMVDGPILKAVVWFSSDNSTWEQVWTLEPAAPLDVVAFDDGFAMTLASPGSIGHTIWTSNDGVDWIPVSDGLPTGGVSVFEGRLLTEVGDSIYRLESDGTWENITEDLPNFPGTDEERLQLAGLASGPYGLLASAYDSSTETVPVKALWFSPDGQVWNRQNLSDVFAGDGSLLTAVGADRVLVAHDPGGEFGLPLSAGYDLWIGRIVAATSK